MIYPQDLREHLVERMLGPEKRSACSLARETGVSQTTLSRWNQDARSVASMTKNTNDPGGPPSRPPRRPQDWTPEERLRAVIESSALSDADLGAWLRREGLHTATLAQWREAALRGLSGGGGAAGDAKRMKDLERELHRKDKALAEAAALLVLRGKMKALWEEEGGSTERS
jgi:transposase-like protein